MILLDSNVVQLLGDKKYPDKSEKFRELLIRLGEHEEIVISEMTKYEMMVGKWGKEAKAIISTVNQFQQLQITSTTLQVATILKGIYNDYGKIIPVDWGDYIIGATAFLNKATVLTINAKDFPAPIFTNSKWIPLTFSTRDGINKTIDLCKFSPNEPYIMQILKEKNQP